MKPYDELMEQTLRRTFSDADASKGLFGSGPIMALHNDRSSEKFIRRGGRIPAPMQSLKN